MRVNGLRGVTVKGSGETASWSILAGPVVVSIDSGARMGILLVGCSFSLLARSSNLPMSSSSSMTRSSSAAAPEENRSEPSALGDFDG